MLWDFINSYYEMNLRVAAQLGGKEGMRESKFLLTLKFFIVATRINATLAA